MSRPRGLPPSEKTSRAQFSACQTASAPPVKGSRSTGKGKPNIPRDWTRLPRNTRAREIGYLNFTPPGVPARRHGFRRGCADDLESSGLLRAGDGFEPIDRAFAGRFPFALGHVRSAVPEFQARRPPDLDLLRNDSAASEAALQHPHILSRRRLLRERLSSRLSRRRFRRCARLSLRSSAVAASTLSGAPRSIAAAAPPRIATRNLRLV